jgi:hypothetical protein
MVRGDSLNGRVIFELESASRLPGSILFFHAFEGRGKQPHKTPPTIGSQQVSVKKGQA